MGIYFSVNGGGKNVELSVHSVTHTALEVSTGENTLAKGNDTSCKLFVMGQINFIQSCCCIAAAFIDLSHHK